MKQTETTSNALKQLRLKHAYTVNDVASAISVSSRQVLKWEKGLAVPRSTNLFKLCALYNTSPEKLYPELFKRLS